jgi:hypothetical protein
MTIDANDKIVIQELANSYANAMDQGDLDAWLDTWAENGSWQGGIGTYEGKQALAKLFEDLGERIQGKRHVMTNFVIKPSRNSKGKAEGEGEAETEAKIDGTSPLEALMHCYLLVYERGPSARLLASGVYSDQLQKIDGQWKFTNRLVVLDSI